MAMENLKKKINYENLLYLILLISPFLDITSFLYRYFFPEALLSPATVIRPIIPICLIIYIYFKEKKYRLKLTLLSILYVAYGLFHILNFKEIMTASSYGTIVHEFQYIVNYTFMIVTVICFYYGYKNYKLDKLPKVSFISLVIYLLLIYASIITNTSSNTYVEGIGLKGWFASGNTIGSILLLLFCICLPYVQEQKNKILGIISFSLLGLFLIKFLGTRTGLYGFILCLMVYVASILFVIIMKRKKPIKNKKIDLIVGAIIISLSAILLVGSNTFKRQKNLDDMSGWITDPLTNEVSHVPGDSLKIIIDIKNNNLEEDFLSEAQKESMLDLYEYANEHELKITNRRFLQFVYHYNLMQNQSNLKYILFGNGYLSNIAELTLESEFLAMVFNFGIIGLALYLGVFFCFYFKYIMYFIKNFKKLDSQFLMYLFAITLSFLLSLLAGYIFINVSSMAIIVTLNILMLKKMKEN
jgi:hypothetical protein